MGRPTHARLLAGLAALAGVLATAVPCAADEPAGYGLDGVGREIPPRGPFRCPDVELVDYGGDVLRYSPGVKIFSGFRDRLHRFEEVVAEVARETYGRAPTRIVDAGAFVCRRMTTHPDLLSEHGLGNAIDVVGFDFGPLPKGAKLADGLPAAFKNAFSVRVDRHWAAKTRDAAVHARFLKALALRLIARDDIFRVLLGPGYPGHHNHFHFDVSPFRLVQIFEDGHVLAPAQRDPPG